MAHENVNYTYESLADLEVKEAEKRDQSIKQCYAAVTDILSLLALLCLSLTVFRIPYLIAILSLNGHIKLFNDYLKWLVRDDLFQLKLLNAQREKQRNRLSIKECVGMTFLEWVKDLIVIPFALIILVLVPWRAASCFRNVLNL